ncbi:hypothetical protein NQ176_g9636 [Zarea fungicola]|uniref:Uncharacterized protein n=1 Tax=Zarea fungicola TaxID=93591 RepID=A0ACC1MLF2_9HYPO|nr:hypothetical protein NQ176_g9636 [Lecanicillium fungicola]
MSSTAPAVFSHRNSLDENGISPRNSHFDSTSPIDGRHSQHLASWYDGSNPPEPFKQPQQLPSLSDMLDKDAQKALSGRLPPPHGSPISCSGDDAIKRAGGSKLPDSRPTGDAALPIHALLSNQIAPNPLYAKAPHRRLSMAEDTDTLEPSLGTLGYGFLSNSPTFRHMKKEQAGDGDVIMTTTEQSPTNTTGGDKGRLDGMSALLEAGEIVGRRGNRH